jgi:DNA (cytosine-5)-methyltransferase 1
MVEGIDALDVTAETVMAYRGQPVEALSEVGDADVPGLTFYEFFAGGGMARAGLSDQWRCLFANDFDFKKSATYEENWGKKSILTKDIAKVRANEIPGHAGLAWASFPCQDLSLAGMGAGLRGNRSGTFWPFWNLMTGLNRRGSRVRN